MSFAHSIFYRCKIVNKSNETKHRGKRAKAISCAAQQADTGGYPLNLDTLKGPIGSRGMEVIHYKVVVTEGH